MATKRQGFWKNYSKKVVEMTSDKNKKDPMDAFWCLNKALLDLYKVMDNKGGQKEVTATAVTSSISWFCSTPLP
jgi:hypothetical protein